MERLELDAPTPAARGEAQGQAWRRELAELIELANDEAVKARAVASVRALAAWAPALHQELCGMARGADRAPEEIARVDAWTDATWARAQRGDEGSSLYVDGPQGPVLACTWDLVPSRAPFVRVLECSGELDALVLTLPGSFGVAGLSADGVAALGLGLPAAGAKQGVGSSALFRVALGRGLEHTKELLSRAEPGGASFVAVTDGRRFDGFELGAEVFMRVQSGARTAHPHTNHCFDPVLRRREKVPPDSTSFRRMELTTTAYAQERPSTLENVWAFYGSHVGHPLSLCAHGEGDTPSTATTWAMQVVGGKVWAADGCVAGREPEELTLRNWRGATTRAELLEKDAP